MKRILVVDGNSIINRAYYGMRPLTTKSGKSTHAVLGTINIISRQMNALSPDYAAVAFDLKAPTFRHLEYTEYKAGRHATPEDLLSQFPDAKECLALMGLHILELPGYEADDIQGTIAKMAHSEPDTVSYILSGDRDLLQLIDDKVTVLLATNSDTKAMHREEFVAEYEILPEQFVDMKALMGDSSDNIPGVAGIGKKTAANLIKEFGSLEGIYENIDDKRISKGVREKLIRDKDNALLSRRLARIITDAPIEKSLCDLEFKGADRGGLYKKFSELELNSLITKMGLGKDKAEKKSAPASSEPKSESVAEATVENATEIYKEILADELKKNTKDRISVQILNGKVYIFTENNAFLYNGELCELKSVLEKKEIICHDGKALYHSLLDAGIDAKSNKYLDLSLYAYALNPGSGASTPEMLAASFIGISPERDTPSVHLFPALEAKMREECIAAGVDKVLDEIEIPLLNLLCEIEENGFKINPRGMHEYSDALSELAEDLTSRIYMQAGRKFNINSPKQLGEVLFVELGLRAPKKTKSGYSTSAEVLEDLRSEAPIVEDILEYRQVTKLRGTYAAVLPEVADENDRIHTDFKQTLTATGRLSSADPNLQNIPIRTKMGREMRRYFIADEGNSLVDADYSQIELRLLAHISGDYNMTEAFSSGEDIHRKTAAAVFGVPEEAVNDEMRKRAKAVNFGIVYGISGFSLAKDIGTSVPEATRYIKNYLMNYPSIDRYLEEVVEDAKKNGYTTTLFGRRRYIPELSAQNGNLRAFGKRVAMNAPIQGTAADIMKLAMLAVDKRLKGDGLDAKIVMQVHDELVIEVADSEVERCKKIVKESMESVAELSVPLTVDVTVGKNWLEQE